MPSNSFLLKAARFANQHQKRGLKRVIDIVRITQELAANPQDHRPVTLHKCLEGRLVACSRESIQELPLGQSRHGPLTEKPFQFLPDVAFEPA